ncbi:MAG: YIP1 family protein [Rhodobacteraceae bacterium]|nr:YIP1 family protein [Paracoccaceae bacterium]
MQSVDYDQISARPAGQQRHQGRLALWIARDTMTHRVLRAWFDMGKSTRQLIHEKPSEARLLYLLLWSDLAFFLSWTLKAVVVPGQTGVSLISVEIGMLFLAAIILRTAAMYVFAMVVGAAARAMGGRGTWRNTRIAVFWGAFVCAPIGVIAALMSVLFSHLALYFPIFEAEWIALPPYYFGMILFVWFISVGVAKAHRFKSVAPIFLAMSVVSLVALLAAMYFHARGMI